MHLVSRVTALAAVLTLAAPVAAVEDFGSFVEQALRAQSEKLFGVDGPIAAPAGPADYVARDAATAGERVKLARGLEAQFVTRRVAVSGDMIALWPDDTRYTHLIVCIEQGRATGGRNAGVQRVDVATGTVETILHGTSACDGIRRTPGGTILATEEAGAQGRAYEILDPLVTTGHWIADRFTGDVRDGVDSPTASTKVVQRPRLGSFSWEGLAILPTGVLYAGDELRPGADGGVPGDEGGALFKFVPASPRDPNAGAVTALSQSPLADGAIYALQVGTTDSGQGNQRGAGKWIGPGEWDDAANPADRTTRKWARDVNATGFYRPEDLHQDPYFAGPGVRVAWNNTGNDANRNYAELLTLDDPDPLSPSSSPVVQTFLEGNRRANSFDNLEFQPGTGNVYVIEDDTHGEIWACLRDGADENLQSDGCVSILSVVDPNAEPTGFIFDATGETAYLVIQHGEQPAALLDFASNPVNGRTDDILRITGFKVRR